MTPSDRLMAEDLDRVPRMVPWALWLSDQWWQVWSDALHGLPRYRPLYSRARAVVLYDQILNCEFDRAERK